MKVGLLGGRFDPPHLGHLLLASRAREALGLDQVWLVPAKAPPHKGTVADAEHRWAMTLLATAADPGLRAVRLELDRTGPSYTVDTVESLRAERPDLRLSLILGADAAADLASWHRPHDLVRMCDVVVFPRPGTDALELDEALAPHVRQVEGRRVDVSGTEIRTRIAAGESIRYLVPSPVEAYLTKHRLFADR